MRHSRRPWRRSHECQQRILATRDLRPGQSCSICPRQLQITVTWRTAGHVACTICLNVHNYVSALLDRWSRLNLDPPCFCFASRSRSDRLAVLIIKVDTTDQLPHAPVEHLIPVDAPLPTRGRRQLCELCHFCHCVSFPHFSRLLTPRITNASADLRQRRKQQSEIPHRPRIDPQISVQKGARMSTMSACDEPRTHVRQRPRHRVRKLSADATNTRRRNESRRGRHADYHQGWLR
jgi:hypothetical protein